MTSDPADRDAGAPAGRPSARVEVRRSTVRHRPGRFAGWPANYGTWAWGDEVVTIVVEGWLGPLRGVHARDLSRPFVPVQLRSVDGGATWREEPCTVPIPAGGTSLSADEHVEPALRVGPRLTPGDFVPLAEPIDFTDPETTVLCARTDLARGSVSWFHVSRDRARTWSGPHAFPDVGTDGMAARTDVVALGPSSALFSITVPKTGGDEGRVIVLRTDDGGLGFEPLGFVVDEPTGWMIMPASLLRPDGAVISAIRCAEGGGHWIDVHRSDDEGLTWRRIATAVGDTGPGGNPPALVALPDGRLVLSYGSRSAPCGLRAVISSDDGASWTEPIVLTDDCAMGDMGYPRSVVIGDDVLTVYYTNAGDESERWIEAVRWTP